MLKDFIKFIFCRSNSKDGQNTIQYNEGTVKGVLDVVKEEYKAEDERNKHIEDKAKSLITLAGVLITICLVLVKAAHDYSWADYVTLVLLFTVILLVISIWKLLQILKIKEFNRLDFKPMITNEVLTSDSPAILARIVATYKHAILANNSVVDAKLPPYNKSISLIEVSILLMLGVVIIVAFQNIDIAKYLPRNSYAVENCNTQCHFVEIVRQPYQEVNYGRQR